MAARPRERSEPGAIVIRQGGGWQSLAVFLLCLLLLAVVLLGHQALRGLETRNQESAAAMARYAADDRLRVSGYANPVIKAMSRIYAREAAMCVATEGLRWIHGAQDQDATSFDEFQSALGLAAVHYAQRGLLADSDMVASALRDSVSQM